MKATNPYVIILSYLTPPPPSIPSHHCLLPASKSSKKNSYAIHPFSAFVSWSHLKRNLNAAALMMNHVKILFFTENLKKMENRWVLWNGENLTKGKGSLCVLEKWIEFRGWFNYLFNSSFTCYNAVWKPNHRIYTNHNHNIPSSWKSHDRSERNSQFAPQCTH